MSKRILGRDLEVSSIGLGCMGMSHAYGRPSDKTEAKNLLAKAVDLGYTMFDTAEVYGTAENPHHNETLLGEILKPYRNQIKIATKGGLHFDENSTVVNKNLVPDSRPEVLKKSVEDSLQRLQMNHLDLYYIHRVDPTIPIEETAGVMKELIDQLPILLLVLLSTALLALYGFKSGYLLASNGVVVSMFLAHFFVIFEIFLITRIQLPQKIAEGIAGKL